MTSAFPQQQAQSAAQTFRLPRSAYFVVLFLLFCTIPLALAGNGIHNADPDSGSSASDVVLGPRLLLLLIPIAAAVFIARTRTRVDERGVSVHALFGRRLLPWIEVRGLSVTDRSVYAVCADGAVRLPCVRVGDLHAIAAASGGRLPDIPPAPVKSAPARRPSRAVRRR